MQERIRLHLFAFQDGIAYMWCDMCAKVFKCQEGERLEDSACLCATNIILGNTTNEYLDSHDTVMAQDYAPHMIYLTGKLITNEKQKAL